MAAFSGKAVASPLGADNIYLPINSQITTVAICFCVTILGTSEDFNMAVRKTKETVQPCCRDHIPFISGIAALYLIMIAILALVRS